MTLYAVCDDIGIIKYCSTYDSAIEYIEHFIKISNTYNGFKIKKGGVEL